jgi:PAS domain S-box-containing protein
VLRLPGPARYAIAIATVGLALVVRMALEPLLGPQLRLLTFFPAIAVSAWLGGLGAGIATTLLSAVAAAYLWMPSVFFLTGTFGGDAVALMLFIAIGLIISGLNEAWRRASAAVVQAADEFRVTLASIGDAVITTDADGRVDFLNPAAQALTGWSAAEAAGRPLDQVFVILDEASRRPAESPVARVLRKGVVAAVDSHTVLLSRDGREIPIDDSAAPIRGAGGRLAGVVMVFRDIAGRKQAERRQAVQHGVTHILAEAGTLRDAASQILPLIGEGLGWDLAALWTVDRAANLLRCETTWRRPVEKIAGLAARPAGATVAPGEGLPGRVWARREPAWLPDVSEDADVRGAPGAAGVRAALFFPVEAGGQVVGVIELLSERRQPPDPDVLVTLSSVANRIGHFLERRRAEEERGRLLAQEQEARREAEAANRAKDDFLAMLSHELRTPLGTILGWTRILRAGGIRPDQAEHGVASIERNAALQARLIEDLLDVARIASGKLTLDIQRVDLAAVVEAALEPLRETADVEGVQVALDVDPSLPAIQGDPARLQQVVGNLVSNALKFTPRDGRVDVRLRRVDRSVEILVRDTGCGISREFLPHVFDRFRQEHPGRSGSGLGLGLAIVRHLVEGHGGTMHVTSEGEGKGATFSARLPLTGEPGEPGAISPGPSWPGGP